MLSLPVPRGKEGREARFRAQTMGAGSLQYSLALYLIDTAATRRSRYPWSQKDPPSTGKGHCSAVRLKAEPESTNWFGGSEVTRSPVLPEFGAGNARATKFPLPASAKLASVGSSRGPGSKSEQVTSALRHEPNLNFVPSPLIHQSLPFHPPPPRRRPLFFPLDFSTRTDSQQPPLTPHTHTHQVAVSLAVLLGVGGLW